MSGVACHHRLWGAHRIERCQALHAIISFGQHTRSNDVGRGMTSPPLDNTHGRYVVRGMTSPPMDRTHARQRRAWHDITTLGLHTRSNNVGRGMQSSPLGSTDSGTALGVACHHRSWRANVVERRRAGHAIIAFVQHRRSYGVGLCMLSSPLASTHSQTTSGVACHHRLWGAHRIERCRAFHAIVAFGQHTRSNDVGRGMTSSPLENTHGRQRRA